MNETLLKVEAHVVVPKILVISNRQSKWAKAHLK